jgi:diguanylate cyclase (GGDEF)-like protein
MLNRPFKFNSDEPLWAVPESVSARLQSRLKNTEYAAFVFCGVYCAVAVFFLCIFGFAALGRGEEVYAFVIFSFAAATAVLYGAIWITHYYFLAKHLITALMGTLCIYLFYTGGTEGSGPVFYMAYPMVAVFLQGFMSGSIYILVLSVLTLFIYLTSFLGFDREIYDFVFISRIATVYIITSFLALFYSYYKYLSERELMFIYEDLEQLTFADQSTGIANRNLIEKLLNTEYKRFKRYGFKFSMMLLSINSYARVSNQYGQEAGELMFKDVAAIIQEELREPDIPALWERDIFIILLPNTAKESAQLVANRICSRISEHDFFIGSKTERAVASVGLTEASEDDLSSIIQKLELLHYEATRQPNNSVIAG